MQNRICLSTTDKKIGGVCGGIAQFFGFESSLVRIIFVLLVLLLKIYPIIIYLVLWAILPTE